jgi:hypothetical protein
MGFQGDQQHLHVTPVRARACCVRLGATLPVHCAVRTCPVRPAPAAQGENAPPLAVQQGEILSLAAHCCRSTAPALGGHASCFACATPRYAFAGLNSRLAKKIACCKV